MTTDNLDDIPYEFKKYSSSNYEANEKSMVTGSNLNFNKDMIFMLLIIMLLLD